MSVFDPSLQGSYRVSQARKLVPIGPNTLLIVGEEGASLLEGRIFPVIAGLVTSVSNFDELRSRLREISSSAETEEALEKLVALGVFVSGAVSGIPVVDAFWDAADSRLPNDPSLSFRSLLAWGDAGILRALEANGVAVRPGASKTLLVTDDYLHPKVQSAIIDVSTYLLAKPVGHTLWIGPVFEEGALCFDCLRYWMQANRWAQYVAEKTEGKFIGQPALSALPSTIALGASLASTAATTWVAKGRSPELQGTIISIDTRSAQWQYHRFLPAPSCNCAARVNHTPALSSLVSPICGLLSRLTVSNSPQAGYYCARAQLTPPLPIEDARLPVLPFAVSGRGQTYAVAEASCIGEAIERYSTIFQGSEPRITRRQSDLGEKAVDPVTLFLFSELQYLERERWNQVHHENAQIPSSYDPDNAIEWTRVEPLSEISFEYVPSAYCYLWYSCPGPDIYCPDSMGCAAGSNYESAILSALLELIERDAVSIWWDNRLSRPVWNPKAWNNRQLIACRDALRKSGRDLNLLDITTDLGVPVCVAVSPRFDGSEPYFASAAGINFSEAASRATSELVYLIWSGSAIDGQYLQWIRSANVAALPYLNGHSSAELEGIGKGDGDPLTWCIERLSGVGLQCGFVDLTRSEVGIPVVRAIVPGLRHPWGRHAPGRLFDVPEKLGWLPTRHREDELNPIICMI